MEEYLNKIDDDLRGHLTEEERTHLMAAKEADPELAKVAAFQEQVAHVSQWHSLFAEAEEEMQKGGGTALDDAPPPSGRIVPLQRRWLTLAAGLALLLAVAATLWRSNAGYSNAALAELSPASLGLAVDPATRTTVPGVTDPFEEGLDAIANNDFTGAANFFGRVPDNTEQYLQAQLYLALAQFKSEAYPAAITSARIVEENSPDIRNRQKAEWLRLKAMLAQGEQDTEPFKNLLEQIRTDESHQYKKEAENLSQKLDAFWRKLVLTK